MWLPKNKNPVSCNSCHLVCWSDPRLELHSSHVVSYCISYSNIWLPRMQFQIPFASPFQNSIASTGWYWLRWSEPLWGRLHPYALVDQYWKRRPWRAAAAGSSCLATRYSAVWNLRRRGQNGAWNSWDCLAHRQFLVYHSHHYLVG